MFSIHDPSQSPLVVIGRQRTGTNLLRSILYSNLELYDFDEIFHHVDWENRPGNFFRFRSREVGRDSNLHCPRKDRLLAFFRKYLAHLAKTAEKKRPLVDVKYNSLHHFNHVWQEIDSAPFLLHLIAQHSINVIHVRRQNTLASLLSYDVAVKNKTWYVSKRERYVPDPIEVNCERIIDRIKNTRAQECQIDSWLCALNITHANQDYEDICQGRLNSDLIKLATGGIEQNQGVSADLATDTPWRKAISNYSEVVTNFEELRQTILASDYSLMLDGLN